MSLYAGARIMRLQPNLLHPKTSAPIAHRMIKDAVSRYQAQARAASTSSSSSSSPSPGTPDLNPFTSDPLNPPATTRPPPLDLPVRGGRTKLEGYTFKYLFQTGKAYLTFYKTGIKAVLTNQRLLAGLPDTRPKGLPAPSLQQKTTTTPAGTTTTTITNTPPRSPSAALSPALDKTANPTRSAVLLRFRVRHDMVRMPLFALLTIICGEFTPFVVLLFPKMTPYTCRIPKQIAQIQRSAESRRAASFRALSLRYRSSPLDPRASAANGHICRVLGLGSSLWDKLGLNVPLAGARADKAVRFIAQDDAFLRRHGKRISDGVRALVDDEVVLACEARGIDTLDRDVSDLRDELQVWVTKTAPNRKHGDVELVWQESADKIRKLLLGLE